MLPALLGGPSARLQRVYAITFPDDKELKDYQHRMEEAKKRDHRNVGTQQVRRVCVCVPGAADGAGEVCQTQLPDALHAVNEGEETGAEERTSRNCRGRRCCLWRLQADTAR